MATHVSKSVETLPWYNCIPFIGNAPPGIEGRIMQISGCIFFIHIVHSASKKKWKSAVLSGTGIMVVFILGRHINTGYLSKLITDLEIELDQTKKHHLEVVTQWEGQLEKFKGLSEKEIEERKKLLETQQNELTSLQGHISALQSEITRLEEVKKELEEVNENLKRVSADLKKDTESLHKVTSSTPMQAMIQSPENLFKIFKDSLSASKRNVLAQDLDNIKNKLPSSKQ